MKNFFYKKQWLFEQKNITVAYLALQQFDL